MSSPGQSKTPRGAYSNCKVNSARRGIPFLLTFEEWWALWTVSGRFPERGQGIQQYCMARLGDKGPYALGNVKIITNAENIAERVMSPEGRARISASKRNLSQETRTKLSIAAKRQWAAFRKRKAIS